jgi:hypothetical protein
LKKTSSAGQMLDRAMDGVGATCLELEESTASDICTRRLELAVASHDAMEMDGDN